MRSRVVALVSVLILLASTVSGLAAQGVDGRAVVEQAVAALNAGDALQVRRLFDRQALVQIDGIAASYSGEDGLQRMMEDLAAEDVRIELIGEPTVDGNRVTWPAWVWLDSWRDLGMAPVDVNLYVTLDNGRIRSLRIIEDAWQAAELLRARDYRNFVDSLFIALNAGDIERTMNLFRDDVVIVGAFGDVVNGSEEARAYYERLIDQHIRLERITSWNVDGDRVTGVYTISTDSLTERGIPAADTIGEFYFVDGRIAKIVAHFAPMTAAALGAN